METTAALRARAKHQDADAQLRLGYRARFHRDPKQRDAKAAARWFLLAAKNGYARARFFAGTCYDFGIGVRPDRFAAMKRYAAAVRQGHEVAAFNLGMGYRDGVGVRRNMRQANRLFRVAALAGVAEAQLELGYSLHEARGGIRRNYHDAASWYRRAARQGNANAQWNLVLCYLEGEGVRQCRRVAHARDGLGFSC